MRSRQESREMPLSSVLQGLGPGDRCYPPFGDRCYFDYDDTETVVCDYGMYMIVPCTVQGTVQAELERAPVLRIVRHQLRKLLRRVREVAERRVRHGEQRAGDGRDGARASAGGEGRACV